MLRATWATFKRGILLVLAGVAVWAGPCNYALKYLGGEEQARLQWPTVKGTVLDSSMRVDTNISKDEEWEVLTVKFLYQVGDAPYVGRQEWPVSGPTTGEYSLGNYWQGKTVLVYYDPADPARALVAPRLDASRWAVYTAVFSMLLGLALVCVGILVLLSSRIRSKPKGQRQAVS